MYWEECEKDRNESTRQSQNDCSKNHGYSNVLQEDNNRNNDADDDQELKDIIDEMLRDFKPSNDIEEVVREVSKDDYDFKNWEGTEPSFEEEKNVLINDEIFSQMEEGNASNGFWEMDGQCDYVNVDQEYQYMLEGDENFTGYENCGYYY